MNQDSDLASILPSFQMSSTDLDFRIRLGSSEQVPLAQLLGNIEEMKNIIHSLEIKIN